MWPTVIVAALFGGLLLAVVIKGILDRKKGKHTCSCGSSCGACPMSGACHADREEKK